MDCLLKLTLDLGRDANHGDRLPRCRIELAAPKLQLGDAPDLDPGDLHRRAGLERAGIVEIDVHLHRGLEAQPAHHDHERAEQSERDQNQDADFDFDGSLTHAPARFEDRALRLHGPVRSPMDELLNDPVVGGSKICWPPQ